MYTLSVALYRSLHEIMGNPDCECTDNPNAVHRSVTLPGTRVTESDCGKPEDELSELVRSGYNTILSCFRRLHLISCLIN